MSEALTPDEEHVMYRHPYLRHGAATPLSDLCVSSVEVDRTPKHSSLSVFNRGAFAGTLTVLRDDEVLIAKRLLGSPLSEEHDGYTLNLGDDECKFFMLLLSVGTVAITGQPTDDFHKSVAVAHQYSNQLGTERVAHILQKLIELSIMVQDKVPEERARDA